MRAKWVANALHVLKDDKQTKFESLRANIDVGLAQAARGEFSDFDAETTVAEGRARIGTLMRRILSAAEFRLDFGRSESNPAKDPLPLADHG